MSCPTFAHLIASVITTSAENRDVIHVMSITVEVSQHSRSWLTVDIKKTGVLTTRRQTGRPRETAAIDDRNIVRTVKKNPKTVSDSTTNAGSRVFHKPLFEVGFKCRNIEAVQYNTTLLPTEVEISL